MKYFSAFVFLAFTLAFVSCNKSDSSTDETQIEYIDTGNYGVNLLDTNITDFQGNEFSFSAKIPKDGDLVVKLKKTSGGNWFIAAGTQTNWAVSNYDSSTETQTFTAISDEKTCDLKMEILPGTYIIEYYENEATTPTRVKQIEI